MNAKNIQCFGPVVSLAAALSLVLALGAEENVVAGATETGGYDLPRCLQTALEKNLDILKTKERIEKQHGVRIEARAASLPHVSLTGNLQQVDSGRLQQFGGRTFGSQTSWETEIVLNQVLFAGGANDAARKKSNLLEQAATTELQSVIREILLQVRERYFAVLLARAQIQVQEQNVHLLEEELYYAQKKFAAGAVPQFDVLRAEVALANGRPPLIRARNNQRLAVEELSRVLGLVPKGGSSSPSLAVNGELAFEAYDVDLTEAQTLAQKNRPELKRFAQLIEAQGQVVRQAKAGYYPQINGMAEYGATKSQFTSHVNEELHGWVVGVNATWYLFDGLATHGKVVQAQSDLRLASLDEKQGRLDIDVEVRRAHSSLVEAADLVKASQKVVEQAVESVRLARSRLDAGVATQLDVLDSEVALTQARTNEVLALHDHNVARARLNKAMGVAEKFKLAER